jgi:putative tryptophan/tyrosine transport system substrate-binding protein
MMERRAFIADMTLGLLAAPLAVQAQQASRNAARIGVIGNGPPNRADPEFEALRQGLRDLGWLEGQNLSIEHRWADGKVDRLPGLAVELVHLNVDVIVASGSPALRAVQKATTTIPIVSAAILIDPVGVGLVTSLAHPGGNITGLASQYDEIVTKQVELLAEAVPSLSRVALLRHASTKGTLSEVAAGAAAKLGLKAHVLEVREIEDLDGALRTAKHNRAQALLVLPSPILNAHRRVLIKLAASHRLPALYEFKDYAADGGLMSYGPSLRDMYRRAASYVDKILKGAKPADLPIERPTKFELVINLKTAKALGLTIPPSLLQRADQVIE